MDQCRKQRGRKAKPRHRIGRHRLELARHHRIGRPYKRGDEGRSQSGDLAGREPAAAVAGEQQYRAGQSQQRTDDVVRRQPLAGQQRREQHDQKRPEIIQQPGFGRRRKAQRQEIQGMVAEQPADADNPRHQWLPERAERCGPPDEADEGNRSADRERHRRELKRRDFPGRNRHHRQQRPHQDRGQSDQGSGAGGH